MSDEWHGLTPSPAVIAAEMAVVGAAIDNRANLEEAAHLLRPDDFHSVAGEVFAGALDLLNDGRLIEPAAVLGALQDRGSLERVGGGPYLHTLMQHAAVGPSGVAYYAELVIRDSIRRQSRMACLRGMQQTEPGNWDGALTLDRIRKGLDEAATRSTGEEPAEVAQAMADLLADLENPPPVVPGVVPPYLDLEMLIPSFRPGELVVVGARPAVGKSTVAVDVVRTAALRDHLRTVMFTLEMPERQVLQRMVAAEARIPLKQIVAFKVTPTELERATDAGARIYQAPLVIDYAPGCTVERIRATLRRMSRGEPLRLVAVDYLGLMRGPRAESRQAEVAAITAELKEMAGEFGVVMLLLSQLNRNPEARAGRKPEMGDLRDSGAVEQDADVVILIHREDAHDPESARAGEVDLIVAKNRNGPTGTVTVASQLHYARFVDMARTHVPQGRPDLRAV